MANLLEEIEKFNKALEDIKDFCNKIEGPTACLKCPVNYTCSTLFSIQPHKWEGGSR